MTSPRPTLASAQHLLEEAQQQEPSGEMADRLWEALRELERTGGNRTPEGYTLNDVLHEEWMRHRY